ncbi:hypothetical protein [uncultured Fluviicola sp.]|uniref:hypothetical protein n=1 Tax=uncultured Fluviicola sp. TaxID=463303 RepID=UPI0025D43C15|nr:hypothetical protein [uncultured Fluviicola sp.]
METVSSFLSSGDNVFKFLLTMCIGTILFNIVYPTDKIREIGIRQSELSYKLDLMNDESKTLYKEIKSLNRLKRNLTLSGSVNFRKKLESFDLKYEQLAKKDYEIKHLRRLIGISRDELDFYSSFRFWSYYPSMIIGMISLVCWINFYVKSVETKES